MAAGALVFRPAREHARFYISNFSTPKLARRLGLDGLALEGNEIAVADARGCNFGLFALQKCCIFLKDFSYDRRQAPAIEARVMKAHNELKTSRLPDLHMETKQWRDTAVKGPPFLRLDPVNEPLLLLRGFQLG